MWRKIASCFLVFDCFYTKNWHMPSKITVSEDQNEARGGPPVLVGIRLRYTLTFNTKEDWISPTFLPSLQPRIAEFSFIIHICCYVSMFIMRRVVLAYVIAKCLPSSYIRISSCTFPLWWDGLVCMIFVCTWKYYASTLWMSTLSFLQFSHWAWEGFSASHCRLHLDLLCT